MIVSRSKRLLGIGLLVCCNVIWVISAEITRYLFIDLEFSRPFFFTYAKSCMLSLFLLRYACACPTAAERTKKSTRTKSGKAIYTRLEDATGSDDELNLDIGEQINSKNDRISGGDDSESYDGASLTGPVEEPIRLPTATDESEFCTDDDELLCRDPALLDESERSLFDMLRQKKQRLTKRVRFSAVRQVRSLPEKVQQDARLARLPYRPSLTGASFNCPTNCFPARQSAIFIYSVYFAPLWMISSVAAQTSLAFASVSSVNLIGASSPLFVLILGAFFGRHSVDAFNYTKLAMVMLNFGGVCVVSRFSASALGSAIALFSSFTNAVYLFALSRLSTKQEHVDAPLMIGTVGLFSLLVCTPLMFMLHSSGLEPQLPLPSIRQFGVVVVNAFIGTVFADSIWLYATLLTGGLTSALSGSLSIPLSMLADSMLRNQPPNIWQVASSVPIMISFLGASYLTSLHPPSSSPTISPTVVPTVVTEYSRSPSPPLSSPPPSLRVIPPTDDSSTASSTTSIGL